PVLVNRLATEGRAKFQTFPFSVFETAVLTHLKEIDPHAILNGDEGPDESLALAAQLAGVEAELVAAVAFMNAHGFSPAIGKRIQTLEQQKRDQAGRLAEARRKAAHPLSESWGEAKTLLGALADAPDPEEARLRLRALLRRIVVEIRLLVVRRGRSRLAAI